MVKRILTSHGCMIDCDYHCYTARLMKVVEQGDEGADAFKWNWMMTSLAISVLLLLLYITVIIMIT